MLDYVSSLVENYYTDRIPSISDYFAEHDDDCYEVTECLKWEILTSDREYSKEDRMFYITVVESEIFKYIDVDEREYTIEDDFESQWSFDFYQEIDRAD
ncbi:MAG: hypothetical protein QNJ38_01315 [Prochloraceae cyanobacterium]|nr:hypothetical protein [Prochloraceae cyanobacterium]